MFNKLANYTQGKVNKLEDEVQQVNLINEQISSTEGHGQVPALF